MLLLVRKSVITAAAAAVWPGGFGEGTLTNFWRNEIWESLVEVRVWSIRVLGSMMFFQLELSIAGGRRERNVNDIPVSVYL
jgi:hypothetical protein